MNLSDNVVGYAIAVVVITALAQKVLATMRHGHWGNILRLRRVLKQLIRLGAEENGPARQFGFMRRIDPFLFEEVILTALKRAGCRIQRNARYTGDGGIDGQCWIRGEHYLIQVKRYSSHINPRQVNDFVQLCRARRAKGLFIHTGKTGRHAKAQTTDHVRIISGQGLLSLLAQGALPLHKVFHKKCG